MAAKIQKAANLLICPRILRDTTINVHNFLINVPENQNVQAMTQVGI